jgi:hypothetical protein
MPPQLDYQKNMPSVDKWIECQLCNYENWRVSLERLVPTTQRRCAYLRPPESISRCKSGPRC